MLLDPKARKNNVVRLVILSPTKTTCFSLVAEKNSGKSRSTWQAKMSTSSGALQREGGIPAS